MIGRTGLVVLLGVASLLSGQSEAGPRGPVSQGEAKGASMSGTQHEQKGSAHAEAPARLERARDAARKFCRHFEFPQKLIEQLKGSPIQKPLIIERDGTSVEVFRWLGHGRGATYVQAEVNIKTDEITVYGALGDHEFGPWKAE